MLGRDRGRGRRRAFGDAGGERPLLDRSRDDGNRFDRASGLRRRRARRGRRRSRRARRRRRRSRRARRGRRRSRGDRRDARAESAATRRRPRCGDRPPGVEDRCRRGGRDGCRTWHGRGGRDGCRTWHGGGRDGCRTWRGGGRDGCRTCHGRGGRCRYRRGGRGRRSWRGQRFFVPTFVDGRVVGLRIRIGHVAFGDWIQRVPLRKPFVPFSTVQKKPVGPADHGTSMRSPGAKRTGTSLPSRQANRTSDGSSIDDARNTTSIDVG